MSLQTYIKKGIKKGLIPLTFTFLLSSFNWFAGCGECDISSYLKSRCRDMDLDGYISIYKKGDDCDDKNPAVHPNHPELCDGLDNNCNKIIDELFMETAETQPDEGEVLGNNGWFTCNEEDCLGENFTYTSRKARTGEKSLEIFSHFRRGKWSRDSPVEDMLMQNLPPIDRLKVVAHVYDKGLGTKEFPMKFGIFAMHLWTSKNDYVGIGFSNPDPTPFYMGKFSWSWGGGQKRYRFAIKRHGRFLVRKDIPTKREKGWHEFSLQVDYLFQTIKACVDSGCVDATFPVRDRFSQLLFYTMDMHVFLDDIFIFCYEQNRL